MNGLGFAMIIYVIFMIAATFGSLKHGQLMMRQTGFLQPHFIVAVTINVASGVLAILVWFLFSWQVNESMFSAGLVLGACLLVGGQAVLFVFLYLKRNELLKNDSDRNAERFESQ